MIRLDSVSKQHGRQILFLEASMGAFAGDRIGLVGPNGAFLNSPTATAWVYAKTGAPACRAYLASMLDRFANFGKPVHVTGIQVPSAPSVGAGDAWEGKVAASAGGAWHRDWSPEIQRAWMRRVYHIALSKPFIESLTWQDFCEDNAHFLPHAGLVCADGKPKPAYEELVEIKRDLGGDTDGHATRSAG